MYQKPKYIYRYSDGERFTLQKNGKYIMDRAAIKCEFDYQKLNDPEFFTADIDQLITNTIVEKFVKNYENS